MSPFLLLAQKKGAKKKAAKSIPIAIGTAAFGKAHAQVT